MGDRVTFSRSLYSPEAVASAAEAYAQIAQIDVQVGADDIVVEIDADPAYGDRVTDGFCNHALFEMVVRTRRDLGGGL